MQQDQSSTTLVVVLPGWRVAVLWFTVQSDEFLRAPDARLK